MKDTHLLVQTVVKIPRLHYVCCYSNSSRLLLSLHPVWQKYGGFKYLSFLTPVNEEYRCVRMFTILTPDGFCCPNPFWTRRMIRIRYNIEPDEKHDCICFTFCAPCNICQDTRELKARGDYPTL